MPGWRASVSLLTVALALIIGASSVSAAALLGTKAPNRLVGTKAADRLAGRAGGDLLKGRAGNDSLRGGRGRDLLVGGPGADRIAGGQATDLLKAADGRADRAVNGGGGVNRCVIDIPLDLGVTRNCGTIRQGSGGGGPHGGGGGGGASTLQVSSAQGLVCLPVLGCPFTITGSGGDATVGSVTGGGAVAAVLGVAVNVLPTGSWVATGTYMCSVSGGPGYLVVTIGSKITPQIPVDCG
jgi:Ca2+-binding RTX toxin-like protein